MSLVGPSATAGVPKLCGPILHIGQTSLCSVIGQTSLCPGLVNHLCTSNALFTLDQTPPPLDLRCCVIPADLLNLSSHPDAHHLDRRVQYGMVGLPPQSRGKGRVVRGLVWALRQASFRQFLCYLSPQVKTSLPDKFISLSSVVPSVISERPQCPRWRSFHSHDPSSLALEVTCHPASPPGIPLCKSIYLLYSS